MSKSLLPLKQFMGYLCCICLIILVQQAAMASGGAPVPGPSHWATKVELTISCENLMDMDIFSKSDPLCALYINTSGSNWYEVCISSWEEMS